MIISMGFFKRRPTYHYRQLWWEDLDLQFTAYRDKIERLLRDWAISDGAASDLTLMESARRLLWDGPYRPSSRARVDYRRAGVRGPSGVFGEPWFPSYDYPCRPWIDPWTPETVDRLTAVLDHLATVNHLKCTYTVIDSDRPEKRLGTGVQDTAAARELLTSHQGWHYPLEEIHVLIIGERAGLIDGLDSVWANLAVNARVHGVFLAVDAALSPAFDPQLFPSPGDLGDSVFPPTSALAAELTQLPTDTQGLADAMIPDDQGVRQLLLRQGNPWPDGRPQCLEAFQLAQIDQSRQGRRWRSYHRRSANLVNEQERMEIEDVVRVMAKYHRSDIRADA